MYDLNMKKVLVLLVAVVIYLNYQNYIKPDLVKLNSKIENLETNIARELEVKKKDYKKELLEVDYDKLFFNAKNHSYSKAMGEMQNYINNAAKGNCDVTSLKWAQVPSTTKWYDKLRINGRFNCKPDDLIAMTNKLKEKGLVFNMENFMAVKDRRKPYLIVSIQFVGYRIKNESE